MTEKQKIFADEYLLDLNATRAYRAAYPSVKKDAVAAAGGSRLLKNAKVSEYIEKTLEELRSNRIADAQEVLQTLTRVLRREEKETVVVTCKERKSSYDAHGKKVIVEQEVPRAVEIPTQVRDVNKAAELLGKRYGLYTDKVDLESDAELRICIDYGENRGADGD